ncbi:MAG TPA: 23S rRNA (uracil(1939)-C(5))-methyltransferase RlmD [Candidatus Acidoferrales bacterium]|nr:23S rRNA (uracil(1939)-C(5))-methyltransferase RlmD [Candidatus Acidoferrales bacterium]
MTRSLVDTGDVLDVMDDAEIESATATISRLARGEVHDVTFTDLIDNGQAVGRIAEMVVFVWGPLPGERARVRIEMVKPKYAVGEMVELLEAAPERVEPFCGVFGICGGCQVQHLAYEAQLAWKKNIVHSALRRIGGIEETHVAMPIGMDYPRAYRNKMSLVVSQSAQGTEFGFYQPRSHDVVAVHECPIVLPQLDEYIATLWDVAQEPPTRDAFDDAKHVVARVGRSSGEAVLTVTSEKPSRTLAAGARAIAQRLRGLVGLSNSFEPASPNAVIGRKHDLLVGNAGMEEAIDGVRFRVSAGSFFQINSEMVGKIFAFMKPLVVGKPNVVDLYCGAGTFALFFAKAGAQVVGIEENPHAVVEARANAELNAVQSRARFIAGRVERMLRASPGAEALAGAEVVFLDPPRKGSDAATLEAIIEAQVPSVWYLSCNPATLARDLAHLVRGGYQLDLVQPFDMFPQTGHIEALATLHR